MNSDENDSSYDLESDDQEMVHYKEVQVITENDQKSQNQSQQQLHQSLTHSDMQQQKSPINYNQSQYSNQIQDLLLDNKQTIDESKNENMVYTNQSNKLMKRINSDQSLFMNNNTTTKNNNITNICIDQNILQDTAKIRKSLSDDQTYVVILKNLLTSQMYNQTTIYLSLNDKKSVINSLKLNHQQLDKNKVLSQLIESEKFKKNQQIYKKFHYQSPKKSQQQSSSFFNQKLDQISNINHQTQSQKKSFFGNSSSKNSLFQEKSPQIFNFHLPKNNSKNQEQEQQQQEQQQQIQMQNLQECDETNQNENDGNSQIQKIQNNNNKVDFSNDVDFDMQQLNIDNFKSFSQSSSSSSSLYTYVTCDDSEDDELENTQQIENNKSIFSQFQYKSNNNSNNNNTNSNSKKNNNKRKYSIKNESSLKSNNNSIRKIQSDQKSKISKQSSSGKKIGKASIENKLFKTQGNEINISAKKLKFDQMQQQKQASSNKKNIKNSAQKSKSSIKKRIKIKKKKKVKKQKCSILISLPENDNNNSNYQKKHRLSIDSPTPSEQERESKYKNIFKISQQLTDCTNNNNNNSNLQSQQKNQQKIQQQQQLSELKKSEKKHKIDIQKQYNPILQQNNLQNVKNQLQIPNQDYKNNNQNQNQKFFQQNILSNKIVDKTIQNNESESDIKVKKYEEGLDEEQEQKQQIQQQQQQQQVKQVVPFHKRELSLQKSSSEYNLSSFEKQLLNKKQFFKVYDQVMTQMTSNNSNSQKPNQQKIQSDQQKIKEIGKKLFQGER